MAATTEPILEFSRAAEWSAWLAKHHDRAGAVLLRIPKQKGSDLTYARALDAALSWGWIDSQKRALDASAWLQRFSRRAAKSPWSKINRARAEALLASGALEPPGLVEVERARADGRWTRAYEGSSRRRGPRGPGRCPVAQPAGARVLRGPRPRQPLRDPLARAGGEEGRDPRASHRAIRRPLPRR